MTVSATTFSMPNGVLTSSPSADPAMPGPIEGAQVSGWAGPALLRTSLRALGLTKTTSNRTSQRPSLLARMQTQTGALMNAGSSAVVAILFSVDQSHYCAYIDESSSGRPNNRQEYLVCAVVVGSTDTEAARDTLAPLLRPGQKKLHWTAESLRSRARIVETLASLEHMSAIISHISEPSPKTERFRRKCLECLYVELVGLGAFDLVLETRSPHQDKQDRAHTVALQNSGLDRRIRIRHCRGGDEPLLWVADAILGAVNADRRGDPTFLDPLRARIIYSGATPSSLPPE